MKSPLKVAAFQMATTEDPAANARKICAACEDAAGVAELLVAPECALSGYLPARDLDLAALAEAQDMVVAHAADCGVSLALGTTTVRDGRWYNTALLFSKSGELVASYDKAHLMPNERDLFTPGEALPVWQIGDWKVGLQICFDMRFPENWRLLRLQGAEVILHLSNASTYGGWKVPVLEGAVRSRAAENGMFVVSANDARAPQMMVSAICDPDGRHLACARENAEGMIFATLDRSQVKTDFLDARRTDLWNRPEFRDLLLPGD